MVLIIVNNTLIPICLLTCSCIRFKETLEQFAEKLELMFTAAGGKKINIITHSMGGLLVKCFMSLHSDVSMKNLDILAFLRNILRYFS